MNDFSVHRIIGRGGFGEVYGCRKADTGKMWEFVSKNLFLGILHSLHFFKFAYITGFLEYLHGFMSYRYAMKCLDKKRIKMKQGETLALNERIMLSLVSTGVGCHAYTTVLWNKAAFLPHATVQFANFTLLLLFNSSLSLSQSRTVHLSCVWRMLSILLISCVSFWTWWMVRAAIYSCSVSCQALPCFSGY